MQTLNELFRKLILANELDNNLRAALRFSDPDGALSGKSGWSFGVCQYDTQNNDAALQCLKECGFSSAEIAGICAQTVDVKPFVVRLQANADIIAKWDSLQLSHCLNKALNFQVEHGLVMADSAAILACADYVNQYGSQGDGMLAWLKDLGRPVKAEDVLTFKLTRTKYGKDRPADCRRRYANLVKLINETEVAA